MTTMTITTGYGITATLTSTTTTNHHYHCEHAEIDPNTSPQAMFSLHGTIPIQYRQTTYNIPVAVWLPMQYPHVPPFAYVRPTPEMVIKPSNHVDNSGRFYHPYLSYWMNQVEVFSLRRKSC